MCEGECVRGMCEGECGNIDQLNTYCNDRHMLRLTGVGAAVRLSCRPSNSPPLASLTRHTLFSDWSKSFNAQYIHTYTSVRNTHSRDGDAFPHYCFKARSDDAGVSQGKLRWGNTSSKNGERRGSVVLVCGGGGCVCVCVCGRGGRIGEEGEEGEEEEGERMKRNKVKDYCNLWSSYL